MKKVVGCIHDGVQSTDIRDLWGKDSFNLLIYGGFNMFASKKITTVKQERKKNEIQKNRTGDEIKRQKERRKPTITHILIWEYCYSFNQHKSGLCEENDSSAIYAEFDMPWCCCSQGNTKHTKCIHIIVDEPAYVAFTSVLIIYNNRN